MFSWKYVTFVPYKLFNIQEFLQNHWPLQETGELIYLS